jgi:hypothetical protein
MKSVINILTMLTFILSVGMTFACGVAFFVLGESAAFMVIAILFAQCSYMLFDRMFPELSKEYRDG